MTSAYRSSRMARASGSGKSKPKATCSRSIHPAENPSSSLPPTAASRVPAMAARTAGARNEAVRTAPSRGRSASRLTSVSAVHASVRGSPSVEAR